MTQRTTIILDEVLQLPESERIAFVERLLESFDDRDPDADFIAELERRQGEARRDSSVLIPWAQVRDMR